MPEATRGESDVDTSLDEKIGRGRAKLTCKNTVINRNIEDKRREMNGEQEQAIYSKFVDVLEASEVREEMVFDVERIMACTDECFERAADN